MLSISLMVLISRAGWGQMLEAPISKVSGDRVIVEVGAQEGIEAGEKLKIYRQEDAVIHPITGEVLGSPKVEIGEVEIVKISDASSSGKVVSSYVSIKPGDSVRYLPPGAVETAMSSEALVSAPPPPMPSMEMIEELEGRVKEDVGKLTQEVTDIQKTIKSLSGMLKKLDRMDRILARDISAMRRDVNVLRDEVKGFKDRFSVLPVAPDSERVLGPKPFSLDHPDDIAKLRMIIQDIVETLVKRVEAAPTQETARPGDLGGTPEGDIEADLDELLGQTDPSADTAGEGPVATVPWHKKLWVWGIISGVVVLGGLGLFFLRRGGGDVEEDEEDEEVFEEGLEEDLGAFEEGLEEEEEET